MIFFAACAANQGDLVAEEARKAGSEDVRQTQSGVEFEGSWETGMRFCLYSRVASRLLMALYIDEDTEDDEELYESTASLPWEDWITPDKTMKVTCTTQSCSWIRNNHYAALRVKDGICDHLKEKFDGTRPDINTENPDVEFHVHVHGNVVKWYADFSGEALHQRGYRDEQTDAVLKEHLAAALISRSEWKRTVNDGNPGIFMDPFCGSGTVAIEAALMASDTAPGLIRKRPYAFQSLPGYDENLWASLKEEAEKRREKAIDERDIRIYASDISGRAVKIAKEAAARAGVSELIQFREKDFTSFTAADVPGETGFIVTDPPYGERMRVEDIDRLYTRIGEVLQTYFKGWRATILTGSSDLLTNIDMKPDRTNSLYNGGILCQAAHYIIFTDAEKEALIEKAKEKKRIRLSTPLSEGADIVYRKILRNLEKLKPEMEKEGVTCYRIYDADIPEYAVAIDLYEGKWINLSEYAAPDYIDREKAEERLNEAILATERATGIDLENIFVKERRSQKGAAQYNRLATSNRFNIVKENGLRLLVNFQDYLDTGIFLDHRPVRKMIQSMAEGKRFLNLFCYTGTATLNAIKGGAVSTVSVDASSTYLDWAIENLKINGYPTDIENFFYRDDAIDWLWETYDRYDLIFCDPPTFSNSKDRRTFDVQRDHWKLIRAAAMHLAPGGILIFSTNFRRFRMDERILEDFSVEDITEETIGKDFENDKNIHKCYLIRNKVKVSLPKKKTYRPR